MFSVLKGFKSSLLSTHLTSIRVMLSTRNSTWPSRGLGTKYEHIPCQNIHTPEIQQQEQPRPLKTVLRPDLKPLLGTTEIAPLQGCKKYSVKVKP